MENGTEQGPIREVDFSGNIREFTAKDGTPHGFARIVLTSDNVTNLFILLIKNGETLASFGFDGNFKELKDENFRRNDPDDYFKDLTADTFKCLAFGGMDPCPPMAAELRQ